MKKGLTLAVDSILSPVVSFGKTSTFVVPGDGEVNEKRARCFGIFQSQSDLSSECQKWSRIRYDSDSKLT